MPHHCLLGFELCLLLATRPVEKPRVTPGIEVNISPLYLRHLEIALKKMLPDIFIDLKLPTIDFKVAGGDVAFENLTITNMTDVEAALRFVPNKGILLECTATSIVATSQYKYDWYTWISNKGVADATLTNVSVRALMTVTERHGGKPWFAFSQCAVQAHAAVVNLDSASDGLLEALAADYLKSNLDDLCGVMKKGLRELSRLADTNPSGAGGVVALPLPFEHFALNTSLIGNPEINRNCMRVRLNGTALYKNRLSYVTFPQQHPNNYACENPRSMTRIFISQMVFNSIFSHLFAYSLLDFRKTFYLRWSWLPGGYGQMGLESQEPVKVFMLPNMNGFRVKYYTAVKLFARAYGKVSTKYSTVVLIRFRVIPSVNWQTNRLHTKFIVDFVGTHKSRGPMALRDPLDALVKGTVRPISSINPIDVTRIVRKQLKKAFGATGGIPLSASDWFTFKRGRISVIQRGLLMDGGPIVNWTKVVEGLRDAIGRN